MTAENKFNQIAEKLISENLDVQIGKMMSSPGIKVNNKVFAFYHQKTMGFRLGKEFNAEKFGLKTAKWLSPFKTKPPLRAWYIIDFEEEEYWENLAEMALDFTRKIK